MFLADQGTTSVCSGACASNWPPLRASGTPKAGKGAQASLLSHSPRPDGKAQVVYNGHPVYTFQGDKKSGETTGQGVNAFGAQWFAVSPGPATRSQRQPAPAVAAPPAGAEPTSSPASSREHGRRRAGRACAAHHRPVHSVWPKRPWGSVGRVDTVAQSRGATRRGNCCGAPAPGGTRGAHPAGGGAGRGARRRVATLVAEGASSAEVFGATRRGGRSGDLWACFAMTARARP